MKIRLDSIDAVKNFVNKVNLYSGDIDIVSGRYTIDAKSIMGIFSLDLSKPLTVVIHDKSEEDKFRADMADIIVE
ncbi:MAG: HPr family phosphocarrier protein [Ruminococcaceae bacterium]|nr:HPr family phosphocarrier protein [Oscillospiraceae bacterium]MBQ2915817.1 HPr family phosphocarrier protein [Clostridia bacterium]